MAANYIEFYSSSVEDAMIVIRDFLVNHVGWYHIYSFSDTASDRDYVFKSDGEAEVGNLNSAVVRIRGSVDVIYNYAYETFTVIGGVPTGTGAVSVWPDTATRNIPSGGTFIVVADKERVQIGVEITATDVHTPSYVGRVSSLYNSTDDPYPLAVKGSAGTSNAFTLVKGRTPLGNIETYYLRKNTDLVDACAPSTRNGKMAYIPPMVYCLSLSSGYDTRGILRGMYQVDSGRKNRQFVSLASGTYTVLRNSVTEPVYCYGPTVDRRLGDMYSVPKPAPAVDFEFRGLKESTPNEVFNYRTYLSTSTEIEDSSSNSLNLSLTNSPTTQDSPNKLSVDFNGTTQYGTRTSNILIENSFKSEYTLEMVVMPDSIAPASDNCLVEYGYNAGSIENENTLFKLSLTTSGTLLVDWESGVSVSHSFETPDNVMSEERWNYVSVKVKETTPSNYDLEIWSGKFKDHSPVLRSTFTNVTMPTGGTVSSLYTFCDSTTSNYFSGRLDGFKLTSSPLSESELESSFSRTKL